MIKKDHDEIWYWYLKIEEFHNSGMKQKEYCDEYEIDYKKFCNMRYRIEYKKHTNPELYEKCIPIVRKYMKSGAPASKFARANDIEIKLLSEMVTHLGYQDIIAKMKAEKEEQPMKFIAVQTTNLPMSNGGSPIPVREEAEVIEQQNDLEIIIAKGVKVSISPNIDTMKVVKIIDFLKDL